MCQMSKNNTNKRKLITRHHHQDPSLLLPRTTSMHVAFSHWHALSPQLLRRSCLVALLNAPCSRRQERVVQRWEVFIRRRFPVLALPRRHVQNVHGVNLLEGSAV